MEEPMAEVFHFLDTKGSGSIGAPEITHALSYLVPDVSSKIPQMMSEYGKTPAHLISKDEFIAKSVEKPTSLAVAALFAFIDKDKDRKLNSKEMTTYIKSSSGGTAIPDEVIKGVFDIMDKNHDDFVTFEEFADLIK